MRRFLVVVLMSILAGSSVPAVEPALAWKVGVATATITPTEPLWMAGYAARNKPAEGKASELYAKALAIEDAAGTRFVIVTLDLISVPRYLRDSLGKLALEKYKLPVEGLLLNCSHTHCGPELRFSPPPPNLDPARAKQSAEYARKLETQLGELIGKAIEKMTPCSLTFFRARCGFAMNRRLPVKDGWANSPNADGPVDQDVPVLRVGDADGKTRAILFGYACHNTTFGFYQWCGDYAGFAQEAIEQANPGAVAMFVMGCGGDQNPYPRGTLELARLHGQTLATSVAAALQTRSRPLTGPLRAAFGKAALDYAKPLPTKADLEKRRDESKDKYDRDYAERLLRQLEQAGRLHDGYMAPVQVVRFGTELTLVALPGETVVDYSLRLKRELAQHGAAVWAAGYSNDVFAYVPSRRVLREGGYEGGGAMKYMGFPHPNPFAENVEDRLIGKVHELLAETAK